MRKRVFSTNTIAVVFRYGIFTENATIRDLHCTESRISKAQEGEVNIH